MTKHSSPKSKLPPGSNIGYKKLLLPKLESMRGIDRLSNGSNGSHQSSSMCSSDSRVGDFSDESNSSQIGTKSGAGAMCDKPFVLDYNEAMRLAASIESTKRLAVALFSMIWKKELDEGMFDKHEYNLNGVSPNGSTIKKKPLDGAKVALLRSFVENRMAIGTDKVKEWGACVTAIHKKLHYIAKMAQVASSSDEEGLPALG